MTTQKNKEGRGEVKKDKFMLYSKNLCEAVDDFYTAFPKYRTKENLKLLLLKTLHRLLNH